MHLLLWRHAEAEDGDDQHDDLARRLTPRGHKQARAMASWIRAHAPAPQRILVSPAQRTLETAAALKLPFTTDARLAPDARASDLLLACDWAGDDGEADSTILVVGHQPTLGEVAALLLGGREAPWSIRKGALWWLTRRQRDNSANTLLRVALSPEFID